MVLNVQNQSVPMVFLPLVDYLMKPVPLERFVKSCNRAMECHELRSAKSSTTKKTPQTIFP